MSRKIGVLTGTFDPIHLGHTELAHAAAVKFGLERVLLWVNADAGHKRNVSAYEVRLQMVRLAIHGDPLFEVLEGELSRRPHVFEAFRDLAAQREPDELIYLMGADTLATIPRWDNVESVVETATFGVAERPGSSSAMEAVTRGLDDLGERLKFGTFEFDKHTHASSRKIREAVHRGIRPLSLDPRVFEFIQEHGLYR
jgi:nicotinate-nucleotide adenylyltransferase